MSFARSIIAALCSVLMVPAMLHAKDGVYRLYEGAQKPATEIAVLRGAAFALASVDGRKPPKGKHFGTGWNREFSLELLPGSHVLEVDVVIRGVFGRDSVRVPLTFLAEAGHEYEIEGGEIITRTDLGGGNYSVNNTGKWKVSLKDLTAGVVLRWDEQKKEPSSSAWVARAGTGGACPITGFDLRGTTELLRCNCPADSTSIGLVWGTDTYVDGSFICAAARHAGVISATGGEVIVRPMPGIASYKGSIRNDIRSEDFGAGAGSYSFERPTPSESGKANPPVSGN